MRPAPHVNWAGVAVADTITNAITPAAESALLWLTDDAVLDVVCAPYFTPALAYDGVTTGLTVRRFALRVGPYNQYARAIIVRTILPSTAVASIVKTQITNTSQVGAALEFPDIMSDTPNYPSFGGVNGVPLTTVSDQTTASSTVPMDRQVKLHDGVAAAVEEFNVKHSIGFGLCCLIQREDIE